jgi:hypothetical protein
VPRDEMDDLPFPLDAALHGEHAGGKDYAALALIADGQITRLATPVSLADPGF